MENVAGCEQDKNGDFVVTRWDGRTETISKEEAVVRPVKVGPPEHNYGDIGQVIYLCNSIGEPNNCLPGGTIPMLPSEEAWLGEVEANKISLYSYIVQLPTGERGIMLAEEVCQPESDDERDREVAVECGWKTADDAWRWVLGVAKKWKCAGFRVFIGYKTGPFDRHELGVFVGWHEMSVKRCKLADGIFKSCRNVIQSATEVKTKECTKLKPFCTPFEDYAHRNGQNFELLRPCSPDEVSKEAGLMFWIRFSDGEEITAYPEEIFEGHEFIS
jgi:hypothetical protein